MRKFALFIAVLFAAILTASAAMADDNASRLADCGDTKVVVMGGTISKDGRYGVGWTLERVNKKAAAVDWSLWSGDGSDLLDHYDMSPQGGGGDDYKVVYFAVDMESRKTAPLDVVHSERHGSINAVWSGETGGKRYGLVQVEYVGGGSDILLVSAAGGKVQQIDTGMNMAVNAMLPKASRDRYTIRVFVVNGETGKPLPVFHGAYADVSYRASIRHDIDSESKSGTLKLRLADGNLMNAPAVDVEGDAIADNPELKKADDELNDVYHALDAKLAPGDREALRRDQRAWILLRNAAVDKAAANAPAGTTDYGPIRDKAQLDATHKRTAELKERLFKAMHKDQQPNESRSSTGAFLISNERTSFEDPMRSGVFSVARRENPKRFYAIYTYPRFADLYFSPGDTYVIVDDHDGSGSNRCAVLKASPRQPYFVPMEPKYVDDACWKLFWSLHPVKGKLDYAHQKTYFCQWIDETHFVAGLQGNSFNSEGAQKWSLDGGWHCIVDAATGKADTSEFTESLNKDAGFSTE